MFYGPMLSHIGRETTVTALIGGSIGSRGKVGGGSVYSNN